MPIHANVAQSCFSIFPMRSAIHSGDQLEHFCSFCSYSQSSLLLHLCPLTLFSCPFFFHLSSNIQESKQHFAAEVHSRKMNTSIIDGFHIARSCLKVSRHHNGAVVLHAQPVFDKTNNGNEKSERNWQQFLIYGRCWRWLIYSTSMQIWFPLLPWLFRFI